MDSSSFWASYRMQNFVMDLKCFPWVHCSSSLDRSFEGRLRERRERFFQSVQKTKMPPLFQARRSVIKNIYHRLIHSLNAKVRWGEKSNPKLYDVHSSFLQPWQKQAGDKSHLQGQQKLGLLSDPSLSVHHKYFHSHKYHWWGSRKLLIGSNSFHGGGS